MLKFSQQCILEVKKIMEEASITYCNKPWKYSGKIYSKAYMTDLLQAIIESGRKILAERFRNGWIEFDTNEDYETAIKWLGAGALNQFIDL